MCVFGFVRACVRACVCVCVCVLCRKDCVCGCFASKVVIDENHRPSSSPTLESLWVRACAKEGDGGKDNQDVLLSRGSGVLFFVREGPALSNALLKVGGDTKDGARCSK